MPDYYLHKAVLDLKERVEKIENLLSPKTPLASYYDPSRDKMVQFEAPVKPVVTNIASKYNSAIAAVDIVVLKDYPNFASLNKDICYILVGRKNNQDKWRLPGGFCDVNDSSYEVSAFRELKEECGDLTTSSFKYLFSRRVNDPRYKNDKDKIFTSVFLTQYISGNVVAGDDLKEVKWMIIHLNQEYDASLVFVDEHKEIINRVYSYLKDEYKESIS